MFSFCALPTPPPLHILFDGRGHALKSGTQADIDGGLSFLALLNSAVGGFPRPEDCTVVQPRILTAHQHALLHAGALTLADLG